ncbi:MAG: protein-L-isoaspartate O-methyltransferase [Kordiimonas sp.]|nr:protein-L-isoaspartate O-methyltransferase [Kordiimonas sp.]|tara:strand:- start:1032 stop:1685 length:654 start_codon:yes stop_codon:yes gene_type:complete
MTSFAQARSHMVEGQIRPNKVTDEALLDVMAAIPREKFVPKPLQGVAYLDEDLLVGDNRYMMEPMVFARLLDAANIKETDVVLDIACGRGYSSAVLSKLSEAVVALEDNEELANYATDQLAEIGCDNVAVVTRDLTKGYPEQGPYDIILINGLVEHVPSELIDQLSPEGRLLCVMAINGVGKACLFTNFNGVKGRREIFEASVPALESFTQEKGFTF